MHSYTAFVYGGLKTPGDNARADGIALARQCLVGLKDAGDVEQFPPQLLVLLVSPAYLDLQDAAQLVDGIREVFEASGHGDIKLVGTSVAAVFFEHEIHDNGALLVCLASRLLDVSTGVGIDADKDPQTAVRSLLDKLGLGDHGKDLNPMSNRMLLTFFPDITWGVDGSNAYRSDELHNLLWNSTLCRIPIAGGVSAGYKRQGASAKGLQFCGWSVYTDTLVVAQVDSGAPLGVSLCRGLETLSDDKGIVRVRVKSLSERGDYIEELEDLRGRKWNNNGTYLLLSEDSTERDFIIARTDPQGGSRFRVIDKVSEGDTLQVRQQRPEMLLDMAADIVDQANRRVHVANPLACLSLICSSHFHNGWKMDLDIQQAIKNIEGKYHTCVGGFVDGEAGVDFTGRSQFGNWSMVGIGFGDEMRDRTPLHRGFKALAAYSPQLTEETKLGDAIKESLNLIFETGFPGAMISFPLRDQSREYIVGMGAVGARFSQIVGETRRPLDGEDALANVIKSRVARFIPDTRECPDCDPIEKALLVSQYVIPLRGPGDNISAVLQIDLGKTDNLSSSQQGVLDSLGAAVGSGLNRILNWEVVEVARQLDHVLKASLQAETLNEGLQSFIEAATVTFGASMGHFRIANTESRRLVLAAGVGDYFEAAKLCRPEIDFDDGSPTCEAYSTGAITIVNDAHNNTAHQELIERCKRTWLEGPLAKVGSYANTAFRGQGRDSIGTINLVSEKTWFFTWQHQHSLKALGERVGFLVEHLEQKEKKAEATRRLNFLLNASPQLNRIQNFDDMPSALHEATERFRVAANAHVASLYLWDEQIGQFIMRAEAGWREPVWVNAARYRKGDGWIGRLESEPMHVYELDAEEERYVRQMFGPDFVEGDAISAIGLPLSVQGKRLGILALYRKERPGDTEGFTKADFPELHESADSIAALLSILRSRQETFFSGRMQEDFKKVSRIFQQDEKSLDVLEKMLCKLITEMFGAAGADFYFYDSAAASSATVSTYSRRGFGRRRARPEADELIAKARKDVSHKLVLREIPDDHRADPTLAATEGRVMRLCVPVFVEQEVAGMLDIRWNDKQSRQGWEVVQHSPAQLRILGTVIGSAHNRYRLAQGKGKERRSKEQEQRKLDVMNKMHLQSAHHFSNLLAELGGVADKIRKVNGDGRDDLANYLAKCLKDGEEMLDLLGFFEKGETLDPEPHYLKPLVEDVLAKSKVAKAVNGVEWDILIDDSLRVLISYACAREALTNIVNNAIEAARRRGRDCMLKIVAVPDEKKSHVEIVFQDFGGGMSPANIEAAKNGQLRTPGHRGWGVLIATGLIYLQDGTFDIESDGKAWTKVLLTLPLGQMEEN
jgi:signal transduction histidine kinase